MHDVQFASHDSYKTLWGNSGVVTGSPQVELLTTSGRAMSPGFIIER